MSLPVCIFPHIFLPHFLLEEPPTTIQTHLVQFRIKTIDGGKNAIIPTRLVCRHFYPTDLVFGQVPHHVVQISGSSFCPYLRWHKYFINQEAHYFDVSKQAASCALGEPNWLVECKSKAEKWISLPWKLCLRQYQSSVWGVAGVQYCSSVHENKPLEYIVCSWIRYGEET